MRVQGSGHADGHEIDVAYEREVGGGGKHPGLHEGGKVLVNDIADVVVAGVDHVHFLFLHVESDGAETGLGLLYGER